MMRDGFITSIADHLIDHQRYRLVIFLNGEFWGIQNIREKVNEHFIASNHSIESEHIDCWIFKVLMMRISYMEPMLMQILLNYLTLKI